MTHELDIKRLIEQHDNTERKYEAALVVVCILVTAVVVASAVFGYVMGGGV